ncbi:MAG: uroporphyrinogen-III C-methyltransferase [Spirochaetales bacterium]|nr:uroporphyrinogen-III C-methyltransferase [Spirochaetales bacterium]
MRESQSVFRAGTRNSNLALIQSKAALERLAGLFPSIEWEQVPFSSPGDRDRELDLKESPADFFSRDLDEAVIRGDLDCALHSAKDLNYPLREELDWFWLPWAEDPRDAIICRPGESPEDFSQSGKIGISSERREAYCQKYFPQGRLLKIRGNIEDRLKQLDEGKYDMLIMAVAALNRLDLRERITRIIPPEDLPVPEGQGILALTYKKGDRRFERIRSYFVPPVIFVGAGPGRAEFCTVRGKEALEECQICLHDSLIDRELLKSVNGTCLYTGKRSGEHSFTQEKISEMISYYARQGKSVVRLKGGDPGIFGRLAEETEELESLGLAYEVVPGVSSLNGVSCGTGMLLTRRGVSRGYTALSSRLKGGQVADTGKETRSALPIVYFMSLKSSSTVMNQLIEEGRSPEEPAAVVYEGGTVNQEVLRGTVGTMAKLIESSTNRGPGLLIVGDVTSYRFKQHTGALRGKKILLTCSEELMPTAVGLVRRWGGTPIPCSLIRLEPLGEPLPLEGRDWLVLTSPGAIRFCMDQLKAQKVDFRRLPRIMVCGEPSRQALEEYGIQADLCPPSSFGADSLIEAIKGQIQPGQRVLRLRSDRASFRIGEALTACGALVEDRILYRNILREAGERPKFDSVFFASSSAVDGFIRNWGKESLRDKRIVVIGKPTGETLEKSGISDYTQAPEASLESALSHMALQQIYEDREIPQ